MGKFYFRLVCAMLTALFAMGGVGDALADDAEETYTNVYTLPTVETAIVNDIYTYTPANSKKKIPEKYTQLTDAKKLNSGATYYKVDVNGVKPGETGYVQTKAVIGTDYTFNVAGSTLTQLFADWGGNSNLVYDATYGLGVVADTKYLFSKTFAIKTNAKVKYEITWSSTSKNGYANNMLYIQIGNVRFTLSNYKGYFNTDGTSTTDNSISVSNSNHDYQIILIYNSANKTIEKLSFDGMDFTDKITNPIDGDFKTVSIGYDRGHRAWSVNNYIKSILVSQQEQDVTSADYTINYTFDGTTIYTTNNSSTVGSTITADNVLTVDGNKYLVVADEIPSITLKEGENTLNVPVRKAYSATLNVTYNVVGTETTNTTDLIEADDKTTNWSYAYPLYKKGEDGKYYKADNTETFGESGTFKDGEVINKTVAYSTADNEVVNFVEAEGDKTGTNYSYSNGAASYVAAKNHSNQGTALGTLSAGSYEAIVKIVDNAARNIVIRDASLDDQTINAFASTDGRSIGEQSLFFTLAEEKNLVANGHNSDKGKANQSADYDYIIIKKLATPTVTINPSSHLASYSNDYAVTVPEDVVIYKATEVNDNTVSLAKVNTTVIPAKTGVILYSATTGEKTLTYGGEADATAYDGNALKATGNSTVTAGDNVYALLAGTQSLAKVQSGIEIPANKAYLEVTGSGAKLNFVIDGQVTGISSVKSEEGRVGDEPAYNLAGQRVGKNYKGIVVKNGRKYIVK